MDPPEQFPTPLHGYNLRERRPRPIVVIIPLGRPVPSKSRRRQVARPITLPITECRLKPKAKRAVTTAAAARKPAAKKARAKAAKAARAAKETALNEPRKMRHTTEEARNSRQAAEKPSLERITPRQRAEREAAARSSRQTAERASMHRTTRKELAKDTIIRGRPTRKGVATQKSKLKNVTASKSKVVTLKSQKGKKRPATKSAGPALPNKKARRAIKSPTPVSSASSRSVSVYRSSLSGRSSSVTSLKSSRSGRSTSSSSSSDKSSRSGRTAISWNRHSSVYSRRSSGVSSPRSSSARSSASSVRSSGSSRSSSSRGSTTDATVDQLCTTCSVSSLPYNYLSRSPIYTSDEQSNVCNDQALSEGYASSSLCSHRGSGSSEEDERASYSPRHQMFDRFAGHEAEALLIDVPESAEGVHVKQESEEHHMETEGENEKEVVAAEVVYEKDVGKDDGVEEEDTDKGKDEEEDEKVAIEESAEKEGNEGVEIEEDVDKNNSVDRVEELEVHESI